MRLDEINTEGFETLLLDRDGTLNVHIIGDYVRRWEDFEFIPGVLDAMPALAARFRHIFVVTNQRGIAKGFFTEEDLADIHAHMLAEVEKAGGRIDRVYHCSALDRNDLRRKPQRGMFDDILRDFPDVDPATTMMVGDTDSDMEFAANCGIRGVKVDSLKKDGEDYIWKTGY